MNKFPTVNELMEMAKNNPELLDELQETENKKILSNQKNPIVKQKLEGLLCRMDMIKRKNKKNHLKTAMEIGDMMHDSKEKLVAEIKEKLGQKTQESKRPNLRIHKREDKES